MNNGKSVNQRETDMTIKNYLKLVRRASVLKQKARSKSALQLDEKAGLFCPPISIGDRAVTYIQTEVDAVIQARTEGQTTEQIKALVKQLIAGRTVNNEKITGGL